VIHVIAVREYNYLVRVKTSITLPVDLLKSIDRAESNRSAFLERAARAYLQRIRKTDRDARDLAVINSNADRLNAEALDVLDYQDIP
jgi:metal-responsive CopG/Arc/MetJ family transcriptional regulator